MTRAPYVMAKAEGAWDRGPPRAADTTLGWRFVNPRLAERHYPTRWARPPRTSPSAGASAASARTRSRSRASSARSPPSRPAASTTRSCRSGPAARRASRSSSPATSTRGPTRASRRWRGCGRPSGPRAARSRPATAPGSTTARQRRAPRRGGPRPRARACSRSPGSSRRPSPGSTRAVMGIGPVPASRKALERAGHRRRRPRPHRAQRGLRVASRWCASTSSASIRPGSTSTAARSPSATRSG